MCEVEIKDESSSSDIAETQGTNDNNTDKVSKKQKAQIKSNIASDIFSPVNNPLTTSFDVLNLLRNSSFGTNNTTFGNKYSDEIQLVIEMQAKEHALRMDILRAQLETAKLNRDIAEINKIILLRSLQTDND